MTCPHERVKLQAKPWNKQNCVSTVYKELCLIFHNVNWNMSQKQPSDSYALELNEM